MYDSSVEPNVHDTPLLPDYASWAVHLGTVDGYRVPCAHDEYARRAVARSHVLAGPSASRITVSEYRGADAA